ncbi:MAG TPA: ATP phosphoribosyltransferase regulatory subunit [Dehalococcoidia bacterium]|nr:ATP phosphoribosyltransferase regulatory subunit [Dehalococcoidia bacterium]
MKIDRCKGFKDITPDEMVHFRFVEDVFRKCCQRWGYREVRTPTLEYLYLFTSVGTLTPGMLRRVYSFLDWDGWSGERVVLKPDGTIPIARMYIENIATEKVARLFYVTNVFMFDETGKKSRERWQCGAELIGVNSPLADAELIALAVDVLRKLGIKDIKLKISHAGLIRALLAKLGFSHSEQDRIFDQILDGDREMLKELKPDKTELVEVLALLLDIKGKSSGFLKNLKALLSHQMPEAEQYIDNFADICRTVENMGCEYRIDLASGKGFEYYTGVIFHLLGGSENIGGGGRYDALIPLMGGKDTPAAGFALYVDRLMKLLKKDAKVETIGKKILVCAAPGLETVAFSIAAGLREAGFIAEMALGKGKASDFDWLLEVNAESPRFVLTDSNSGKEFWVESNSEVINLLGCR